MTSGQTIILVDARGRKAAVTIADVRPSNGVIHVLDAVLLPQVTIETLASLGIEIGG